MLLEIELRINQKIRNKRMARLKVRYTVSVEEYIDWPDDELENLNYENLLCNCDVDNAHDKEVHNIESIAKDGISFWFE